MTAAAIAETRSLDSVRPGETVVVHAFVLPALRRLCADIGLLEGDVVRCRVATPSLLLLELSSRQVTGVARDWARFIRVEDAAPVTGPPV